MNTFKQSLWLCLIIIGLAYGGWYFIRPAYQFKLDETSLLTLPDGYAKNLSIQQFDEKGHLNHHLQALSMQSIPQDNAHDFKMPVLTLYEDNQAPWVISAKTARRFHESFPSASPPCCRRRRTGRRRSAGCNPRTPL